MRCVGLIFSFMFHAVRFQAPSWRMQGMHYYEILLCLVPCVSFSVSGTSLASPWIVMWLLVFAFAFSKSFFSCTCFDRYDCYKLSKVSWLAVSLVAYLVFWCVSSLSLIMTHVIFETCTKDFHLFRLTLMSPTSSMPPNLLPSGRLFWSYHCCLSVVP